MNELPRWAVEMRDLFRAGSAAQFLIHGNVFDVVPHGGRMLSVPAFLDEVMFGSYDVVLRYDRSRGVRATRGAEDWGNWLDQALGREGNLQSLLREPGSALELIDRYLLRTLNLRALTGTSSITASSALSAPRHPPPAPTPPPVGRGVEFARIGVPPGGAPHPGPRESACRGNRAGAWLSRRRLTPQAPAEPAVVLPANPCFQPERRTTCGRMPAR